jgi:hypothetical protein
VEEAMTGEDAVRAVTPEGLAAAISDKAPLASPMFTGTPIAPTAASGTDTTQIATTAFVKAATSGISGFAPTTAFVNASATQGGTGNPWGTTVTMTFTRATGGTLAVQVLSFCNCNC